MILVSFGRPWDVVIQAAYLQKLNCEGTILAVTPESAPYAREIFGNAKIVEIPYYEPKPGGEKFEGWELRRLLRSIQPGAGRMAPVFLQSRGNTEAWRSTHLYRAHFYELRRHGVLRGLLPWSEYSPSALRDWRPFGEIRSNPSGALALFADGPLGATTIQADRIREWAHAAQKAGLGARIVIPPPLRLETGARPRFEDLADAVPLDPAQPVTALRKALAGLSCAVSAHSALYHLAVLHGFPTLAIDGPDSTAFYTHPDSSYIAPPISLACAGCGATHACYPTRQPVCLAIPSSRAVLEALSPRLGVVLPLPPLPAERPLQTGVPHFDPTGFRRAELLRKTVIEGTLASPLSYPLKAGVTGLRRLKHLAARVKKGFA
jgi:hypothetical protein